MKEHNISSILNSAIKKIVKFRLRPIRVFVFHQVSERFESQTMWECDWTEIEQFKRNILNIKNGCTFISLQDAYKHLQCDVIRSQKYAVLTADDGWASLRNIIPWLVEQQIPVTLFLNPLYLDGAHHRERETEKYLNKQDVEQFVNNNSPYITIASHGWTHMDCSSMDTNEFIKNVQDSEKYLSAMNGKIEFYAYTYGRYKKEQNEITRQKGLVPVLVDGMVNYNDITQIHRECIDGKMIIQD